MRFAIRAGFAIGILLPVLETYRRGFGEWRVDFTTMFEDYLAGALLLVGAWAAARRRQAGKIVLLVGCCPTNRKACERRASGADHSRGQSALSPGRPVPFLLRP